MSEKCEQGPLIAVVPWSDPEMHSALAAAVVAGGGVVANGGNVEHAVAMVWADPAAASEFPSHLTRSPEACWVQLPYAGVEAFAKYLDDEHIWTCGKGVYAQPVAEHVLALALAGFRNIHGYSTLAWSDPVGRNLFGARVTILGAGGIADSLLALLEPFRCHTTVVRRRSTSVPKADRTVAVSDLDSILPDTDVLVVAWALTDETAGRIDASVFHLLPNDAWLINVGRGGHVVTEDLVVALEARTLGGAALDVTDPEPLPADHRLWQLPNCIITPHIANTPDMGRPLLAERVRENVELFVAAPDRLDRLVGLVDVEAGY
ncbi:MAG: hydroxyacid dehydrogenase [Actinobacteria bacterium]|nr:hydroxyacid dehydrogenase [Actinomycetota bacterium]